MLSDCMVDADTLLLWIKALTSEEQRSTLWRMWQNLCWIQRLSRSREMRIFKGLLFHCPTVREAIPSFTEMDVGILRKEKLWGQMTLQAKVQSFRVIYLPVYGTSLQQLFWKSALLVFSIETVRHTWKQSAPGPVMNLQGWLRVSVSIIWSTLTAHNYT